MSAVGSCHGLYTELLCDLVRAAAGLCGAAGIVVGAAVGCCVCAGCCVRAAQQGMVSGCEELLGIG